MAQPVAQPKQELGVQAQQLVAQPVAQVQAQQLVAQPVAQVQAQPAEQMAEEDNSHIVPFVEPASVIGWDLSLLHFCKLIALWISAKFDYVGLF